MTSLHLSFDSEKTVSIYLMTALMSLPVLPAVRAGRRRGAFRVIELQWMPVGLPTVPLVRPPRRGIRKDPGRVQLCTLCILTPEISDTVYVRGRLPLTCCAFINI